MDSEHSKDSLNKPDTPSKWRPAIVVMRWLLVIIWIGIILFSSQSFQSPVHSTIKLLPSIAGTHFVSYGILCFLLANALWQHMPLKKAIVVAIVSTCLLGGIELLFQQLMFGVISNPILWLIGVGGTMVGALVAYPLLQVIDRLITYGQN